MRHRTAAAGALAALLLAAVPGATAQSTPPAAGPLVMVGNRVDPANEPVYRAILGLRSDARPICILQVADDRKAARSVVELFERYGGPGAAVEGPKLFGRPGRADKEKVTVQLEACGGFYFVGGDAIDAVDALHPDGRTSLAEQAILRVHRRGGVIATSGNLTLMMGDPMLDAGSSDDAMAHGFATNATAPGVRLRNGIGFFRGGLVDARDQGDG